MRLKHTKKWNQCYTEIALRMWGLQQYIRHIESCTRCKYNYNNKLKLKS